MPIFQQSWKSSGSKFKLEGSKNAEKINRSIEVEYCRRETSALNLSQF
jgi:hypothetical protein